MKNIHFNQIEIFLTHKGKEVSSHGYQLRKGLFLSKRKLTRALDIAVDILENSR
jgi:hypothetical protein